MAPHKLSILVEAIGAAKAAKNLQGVDRAISNIGARAGKGLRTAGDNLLRLGTIAGGIAAAGVVGAVKAASDFESQLNTINTVARATPDELDKIGQGIRKVARDTGTPLADLTQGYYDLVSAGIAAGDAQGVLEASNKLAIGGLASTAETVDLLTTAINAYKLPAKDATRIADIFAKSIERGKVTAADIGQTFAQVGPLAASYGIDIEEIAAAYAQLSAQGFTAGDVATQFRSALVALAKRSGDLEKLEKKTKKSYLAIAGEKGLVAALEELRVDAAKNKVPITDLLGRVEALNFLTATTGTNLPDYNDNLKSMGEAAGTAAEQMSERQKGLNFQISRLKNLAIDAGITIGSKLLPKITPLAERAVKFLDTHQADISAFGDKIAGAFDKALRFAEKIPWDAIGSGLRTAADWAAKLMDVFLKLPPDVQTTIIALAGLNKLSGGAIGGIVSELGKGLIKGVLSMNAAVVNVNAGVVKGGGVPVPAAGGGGASTLRTAAQFILPVAAGVVIANAIREVAGLTPEQSAARQNQGQFGPRTSGQKTPAMLDEAKIGKEVAGAMERAKLTVKGITPQGTPQSRAAAEAQRYVGTQIDKARSAQTTASDAIKRAVDRQKTAINAVETAVRNLRLNANITVPVTNYVSVSNRDIVRTRNVISRYGRIAV